MSFKLIILHILLCLLSLTGKSQEFIIKDIKEFGAKGDGKNNDHAAFKKAAAFFNARSGNGKLIISNGKYLVGNQVKGGNGAAWLGEDVLKFINCSNFTIQGSSTTLIKMKDSMLVGSFDPKTGKGFYSKNYQFTDYEFLTAPGSIFYFKNCSHIAIVGMHLDGGNRSVVKGGKFGDNGYQVPGDGICLEECNNVIIKNLTAEYCVRDGVQVINKTSELWNTASQKIKLFNSIFNYNGRQGLSWVGGVGLKAVKCKFTNSGMGNITSAPGAGVDIEAEVGIIRDGVFIDCEFINNSGCGFVADSGPSRDMNFYNCTFWGIKTWSMWTTKPNYNFTRCKFYGSIVQGYDSPSDIDATKFIRCIFKDSAYNNISPYGLYLVEINQKKRVLFKECIFTAKSKKIFWFEGDNTWKDREKPLITKCIINIYPSHFKLPDFIAKMHGIRWNSVHYFIYMKKEEYEKNYYMPGGSVTFTGITTVKYLPQNPN
jgi:hypothetical protein